MDLYESFQRKIVELDGVNPEEVTARYIFGRRKILPSATEDLCMPHLEVYTREEVRELCGNLEDDLRDLIKFFTPKSLNSIGT